MDDLIDSSEDSVNILYANVYQKLMFVFVVLMLVAFAMIQPIIEKLEHKNDGLVAPAGNLMIEVTWPDKINVDVDTWVQSPDDTRPVGYSNPGGKILNLIRDDMGTQGDPTERNYEMVYGRSLPEGEYTINLHLFSNAEGVAEVPVKVMVSTMPEGAPRMSMIITRNVTLKNKGEEITVVRFSLDKEGKLVKDSEHDLFKELRSWSQSESP